MAGEMLINAYKSTESPEAEQPRYQTGANGGCERRVRTAGANGGCERRVRTAGANGGCGRRARKMGGS
jgi:hypothetical protein